MTSHDPEHPDCRELFARLSEYLDRELDTTAAEEIRRHLEHCPPCQICLGTLQRTVSLCAALERQPVPANFSRRLMAMLDQAVQGAAAQED